MDNPGEPAMKYSDSLAVRTLLTIARQRQGLDSARCQLVFEHIDTAMLLREALQKPLHEYHLSYLQFAVLVVLFTLDPDPVSAAVLADHTLVSRSAITEALDHLELMKFAVRTRDTNDRRMIFVRITQVGRQTVDQALMRVLNAAGSAAHQIDASAQQQLHRFYHLLQEGAPQVAP